MKLPKKIVLATNNRHKVDEITQILAPAGGVEFLTLGNFPNLPEVAEEEATFAANALKKAMTVMEGTNLPALADDSGLEVDALYLAPGVRSARYSGKGAAENNRLLLMNMQDEPDEKRTARFKCVVALCVPGTAPVVAEGRVEGRIGHEEKGKGGFGYDPLFIPDGYSVTFAEMAGAEKNALSHRANALKSLLEKIQKI
jgi:XTP/dITP diphosphohydrolase